jgi:hypothetical protein
VTDEAELRKEWVASEIRKYHELLQIIPPAVLTSPLFDALVKAQVVPYFYFVEGRAREAESGTPSGGAPSVGGTGPRPMTAGRAKIHIVISGETKANKEWLKQEGANFHWDDKVWIIDLFDEAKADIFLAGCRNRKLETKVTRA